MPPGKNAIMWAERSRFGSMPFGLSRAGNAIFRVNILQEVSELLLRPYSDAVVHPESGCGEIVAGPGTFDVNRCTFGLTLRVSVQLLVSRSPGVY